VLDNAVGAWAPSLLIRNFGMDEADVGRQLGLGLMLGYGGGMLVGGMGGSSCTARRLPRTQDLPGPAARRKHVRLP
jgi:hypothetical protein